MLILDIKDETLRNVALRRRDECRSKKYNENTLALNKAFDWSKTPEGYDFWNHVHLGLINAYPVAFNVECTQKKKSKIGKKDIAKLEDAMIKIYDALVDYNLILQDRPSFRNGTDKVESVGIFDNRDKDEFNDLFNKMFEKPEEKELSPEEKARVKEIVDEIHYVFSFDFGLKPDGTGLHVHEGLRNEFHEIKVFSLDDKNSLKSWLHGKHLSNIYWKSVSQAIEKMKAERVNLKDCQKAGNDYLAKSKQAAPDPKGQPVSDNTPDAKQEIIKIVKNGNFFSLIMEGKQALDLNYEEMLGSISAVLRPKNYNGLSYFESIK